MSYILDALKKSEQERQQHQAPTVHSIYASSRPLAKSASISWLWIMTIVMMAALVCAVLLWWYSTNRAPLLSSITSPVVESSVTDASVKEAQQKPVQDIKPIQNNPAVSATTVNDTSAKNSAEISPNTLSTEVDNKVVVQPLVTKASLEQPAQVSESEEEMLPVMQVEELPDTVRNSMPAMKYSFHVYSTDKNKCTIIINNRRYREGEMIAGGWLLDRITETGIVLRKERYRAAIQVVDSW